ncbi:hypothetical protein L2755_09780 [Shewanella abyssi]|uniref:hypothetical protein n=1 Tax=Shewanella abyssi TaxID=311789 RepID=UPI00200FC401|nr:hypothetical protein [Shewanella abyssi]MCL1049909.1 hypothetical protein [Shewanella abyssi]
MRLMPLFTVLFLASGCTADEANLDKNSNAKATKVSGVELVVTETDKLSASRLISYQLNGAKFIAESDSLIKGTRVFNPEMTQGGVLRGSFVVQSGNGVDEQRDLFSVMQIAAETYRLTPIEEGTDLFTLYKSLKLNANFSSVEIEIDYSRQHTMNEY